MNRAVVYYHDHCVDGFASAWAFRELAEAKYTEVEYIAVSYGEPPQEPKGEFGKDDCYILDFSFPKLVLCDIAAWYTKVYLFDHHKTAIEALSGWESMPKNITMMLDTTRSGAVLTWVGLNGALVMPHLLGYVQDRDLWKFHLPFSREINSLIGFTKKTFTAYDVLAAKIEDQFDSCVDAGALLLEQQIRHVDSIVATTARSISFLLPDGTTTTGLVCNCNGQFAADVGNVLAKRSGTFGATYYSNSEDNVKFSLRSIGDYDVTQIAKQFGGGGHKNAAGFEMKQPQAGSEGVTLWSVPVVDRPQFDTDPL